MKRLLREVCERDVEVIFHPLIYASGILYLWHSGWKCIVNSNDPYVRKRFTLAHELYHYDHHRNLAQL